MTGGRDPLKDAHTEWGVQVIGTNGQHVIDFAHDEAAARAFADANRDGRTWRTVLVSREIPDWSVVDGW